MNKKRIGIDVGGSHVAGSIVCTGSIAEKPVHIVHKTLDSGSSASNILQTIGNCINELLEKDEDSVDAVGIAFPGPFEYEKGISVIAGVGGKFSATFGMHVGQALKNICGRNDLPFSFSNDAHCFAVGANEKYNIQGKKKIFLTLGTGFGSAFMDEDALLNTHADIPASGAFYDQPFLKSIADDHFSTRWILHEYENRTGKRIASVKALANSHTVIADEIFAQFGRNLGAFLLPWLQQFNCDDLIIGGNISRAFTLFGPSLFNCFKDLPKQVKITYCASTEECILMGAAAIASKKNRQQNPYFAQMDQIEKYDNSILPIHQSSHGFKSLAEQFAFENILIIDGHTATDWEYVRHHLNQELCKNNKHVFWYDINACLKSNEEIALMIASNAHFNDLLSGKKYYNDLIDFFDLNKLSLLKNDAAADMCIVYGAGAALSNWPGPLIYVDGPEGEEEDLLDTFVYQDLDVFQHQQKSQSVFFQEPVLAKYKQQLETQIQYYIQQNADDKISWFPKYEPKTLNS